MHSLFYEELVETKEGRGEFDATSVLFSSGANFEIDSADELFTFAKMYFLHYRAVIVRGIMRQFWRPPILALPCFAWSGKRNIKKI